MSTSSRAWSSSVVCRYGFALLITGVATLTRWALPDLLDQTPYLAFYPAVVAAAAFGGFGPAALTTILSFLVVDLAFDQTQGYVAWADPVVFGRMAIFLAGGLGTGIVAHMQHASRARERRQAEEAIRSAAEIARQKELLAVTLASIGDAVIVTDAQGRVTFLNGEAERLTGWKAADASGRLLPAVFNIVNETTRQPVENPVDKVLRLGTVVGLANHTILIAKDGRETPIDDSGAPIRHSDGTVQGVVLVFRDFSEQKASEVALQESERRVRQKLESILSPEGDIGKLELEDIIDAPAIQTLMDNFYQLARIPMAIIDLKGKVLVGVGWQNVCTQFHRVHPETCRNCIESDTMLSVGIAPGEFKLYKCKNSMWDVATPITVGGRHMGNLFSGQFFFDDETVDVELFRSQARQYGFDEVAYLAALNAVPRLSRQSVDAAMGFFMKLADILSLLSYGNIKLARSAEDLSAAKVSAEQAKAAAEQANAAKDHFLAVLSHELRTPLTPVLTAVSMLQAQEHLDHGTQETLEMVRRNVELEARLIDDLLDLTRIVKGKIDLQKQRVELCTVIARAVEVCRSDIEARGLHFGVDIGPDAPYWLEVDPARLQQVLWNLLKNAIKFTPHDGCAGIRCRLDGDHHVVIEVNDSGIGIGPHDLARIFDAFEQAERSITRQFGGLGLGLAISKALVEMHGGQISAHSDGKGKGSSFRVRLPLVAAGKGRVMVSPDGRAAPAAVRPPTAVRPLRILLVEDHGDTARMMRILLGSDGHEVEMAGDVATALELAHQDHFDLLLSDLGLPDGSGHDLMRELRQRGHKMPGIALSGYGQEEDVQRSKVAGFAAHLTKPITPERLVEVIASVAG